MTIGTQTGLGSNSVNATNTSLALTTGTDCPVGSFIFVGFVSHTGATLTSVSDSVGNVYTVLDSSATSNVNQTAYCANSTVDLPSGGTITAHYGSVAGIKVVGAMMVAAPSGMQPDATVVDKKSPTASGTSTSATSEATGTLSFPVELIIGIATCANADTGAFSAGGSFTPQVSRDTSGGSMLIASQAVAVPTSVAWAPSWVNSVAYQSFARSFVGSFVPPNYDFPNPTLKLPTPEFRTFAVATPLSLSTAFAALEVRDTSTADIRLTSTGDVRIVFDGLPPGINVGPAFDWPNPTLGRPNLELRAWAQDTPLNLITGLFPPGLRTGPAYDFPNPTLKRPNLELRTAVALPVPSSIPLPPKPPSLLDQPNPTLKKFDANQRTFLSLPFKGQDALPKGGIPAYDFPNPTLRKPNLELRSFLFATTNPPPFVGLFRAPLITRIWPRDPGRIGSARAQEWLLSSSLELLLQDQFYDGPGLAPNFDWTNPSARKFDPSTRTWLASLNPATDKFFGLAGAPNFDQPNPQIPRQPNAAKTHAERTVILASTAFTPPDLPNPTVKKPNLELRNWVSPLNPNLQDNTPAGVGRGPNYDWPNPTLKKFDVNRAIRLEPLDLPLLIPGQSFGLAGNPLFDQPNPLRYLPFYDRHQYGPAPNLPVSLASLFLDAFAEMDANPVFADVGPMGFDVYGLGQLFNEVDTAGEMDANEIDLEAMFPFADLWASGALFNELDTSATMDANEVDTEGVLANKDLYSQGSLLP